MAGPHLGRTAVLVLAGTAFLRTAHTTPVPTVRQAAVACRAWVYVADRDPAGLNVRAGPGGGSEVIGRIPRQHAGTMLRIVESRGGWLRYDTVVVIVEGDKPAAAAPRGGWVFGALLGTTARPVGGRPDGEVVLRQAADTTSAVRGRLRGEETLAVVRGCSGAWLEVAIRRGEERLTGWLAPQDQCGNPVTTCP